MTDYNAYTTRMSSMGASGISTIAAWPGAVTCAYTSSHLPNVVTPAVGIPGFKMFTGMLARLYEIIVPDDVELSG